jgi:hypothetical protein
VRSVDELSLAVLFGLFASPRPARAQDTGPVRIEYSAPETCPAKDAFLAEVRARTPRATVAREGESARIFQVTLAWTEEGARGTLALTEPDGTTSFREVNGDTCAAVASAIALVTVLAIDPSASTAPISLVVAGSAEAQSVPLLPLRPPLHAPPLPASPPPPRPSAPPSVPFNPGTDSPPAPDEGASKPLRLQSSASLGLHVLGVGGGAGTVFGPSFVGALAMVRSGLLAPELRAGVSYASSGTISDPEGSATFAWWRGELEVCPLRFALASTLNVRPCAAVQAGAIVATGHGNATSAPPATELWGELGASVLLEWDVVGPWRVEAEAGLGFPLTRRPFGFTGPNQDTVYAPTVVMPEGRIGLAVHFP